MRLAQFALAGYVVLLFGGAAAAQPVRTIALTGQQCAGTPDGVLFDEVRSPAINLAGNVAFSSSLIGPGIDGTNDAGVWTGSSGTLELAAQEGQHAPGIANDVRFDDFYFFGGLDVLFSSDGNVAFRMKLTGDGVTATNNFGIWSGAPGALHLVARQGSQAVGLPDGVNYQSLGLSHFNTAGQMTFGAFVKGPGITTVNDAALWSEGSGVLSVVQQDGDHAPGLPDSVRFFGTGDSPINSAGHSVFLGTLAGPGIDFNNDKGFWTNRSGSLELIVREGDQAPGLPSGVRFDNLAFGKYTSEINAADQIAFAAKLRNSGSPNDYGIWSEGSGSLQLVVRTGDHAPGTLMDVNFLDFEPPELNSASKIAFEASLMGASVDSTNDSGIWSDGFGALELVAREGAQIPDTANVVVFDGTFNSLYFNANGQTAFAANLRGDGVDSTNDQAIFAQDAFGVLRLIAREGNQLEVAPGDNRTIAELSLFGRSGLGDGRGAAFSERGQLAFRAVFTDGTSGIFVSDLVAVPEPTSALLMLTAFVAFVAVARRKGRRRSAIAGVTTYG